MRYKDQKNMGNKVMEKDRRLENPLTICHFVILQLSLSKGNVVVCLHGHQDTSGTCHEKIQNNPFASLHVSLTFLCSGQCFSLSLVYLLVQ